MLHRISSQNQLDENFLGIQQRIRQSEVFQD